MCPGAHASRIWTGCAKGPVTASGKSMVTALDRVAEIAGFGLGSFNLGGGAPPADGGAGPLRHGGQGSPAAAPSPGPEALSSHARKIACRRARPPSWFFNAFRRRRTTRSLDRVMFEAAPVAIFKVLPAITRRTTNDRPSGCRS